MFVRWYQKEKLPNRNLSNEMLNSIASSILTLYNSTKRSESFGIRLCYNRMWVYLHTMTHIWDKLCGFVHYNVLYVMFIVTCITLKL